MSTTVILAPGACGGGGVRAAVLATTCLSPVDPVACSKKVEFAVICNTSELATSNGLLSQPVEPAPHSYPGAGYSENPTTNSQNLTAKLEIEKNTSSH